VFKDNREIGVYDRIHGSIRGLEEAMSRELQEALEEFKTEINERGL
jgi:hypothetical protein